MPVCMISTQFVLFITTYVHVWILRNIKEVIKEQRICNGRAIEKEIEIGHIYRQI